MFYYIFFSSRYSAYGTPSRIPLIRDSPMTIRRTKCDELIDEPTIHHHNDNDDIDSDDNDTDSHQSNALQVPIILILIILISYITIGTVIFSIWENWSMIDGAYFCFVTLSTIGFGDLVPRKIFLGPDIQLYACCAYLLLGLVLVAMSFTLLETQLIWKCKRMAVRLKLTQD